ncbi:hypothetical protein NMY3_00382 [Candidatus Nitrosocosmicus oleophilus]|uniref:Uncharacterized protein n=1 Tax=Candidatus Nitrosocosmicus oleophilus TaxID=1353260 RepID=A0A654LVX5_9ARCH|nr:hypothetical protein [Candidatus Nitrosocosmicus oleophilus]ALI34596.1 hypothetical protein NMY3_00382 [Candidatus Nitrosocosmicus oleophilus]
MGQSFETFLKKLIDDPLFLKIVEDYDLCRRVLLLIHKKTFLSLDYEDLLRQCKEEIGKVVDNYYKVLEKQEILLQQIPSTFDLVCIFNKHYTLLISQISFVYGVNKEEIYKEWINENDRLKLTCIEMILKNAILYNMKNKITAKISD